MAARRLQKVESDGVQLGYVGTGIWAILAVLATVFQGTLEAEGMLWWRDVALAGFVLGLIGLRHVIRRRRRLRAGHDDPN